jgi:SAM-dependent methyltransferase
MQFGGSKVTKSDILHVDDENPNATIIGDLSNAPTIPSDSFDCIILTQTLHLVYDYQAALRTCYRILKPGGVLLFTVPGITPIDHDKWKFTWYWSFTSHSVKKFTGEIFPGWNIEVESFGNVFVATAFLYGMGLPEVSRDKMDYHDDHYQLIITAKCIKP